ncbi:hypothetical protein ES708_17874 [subsurface metagenome]
MVLKYGLGNRPWKFYLFQYIVTYLWMSFNYLEFEFA